MDSITQMRETLANLIHPDSSEDLIATVSRAIDWFTP
ncbi:hypothetical protein DOU02_06675 [Clavibacter michiganensis subsp. michiganensis]|nr:hypothetical protein DOU02_06675 [Clavibacter michiganensis subsp. michiganensis]